jgi:hypothetical protein
MKTPEQIINEIKTFISTSKPFRFSGPETTVLDLLNELENTLNPQPIVEEIVIEEPIVEETVVEAEVVEETVVEDFDMTVEEPVIDEVIEETVTEEPVAKTTKKSKK